MSQLTHDELQLWQKDPIGSVHVAQFHAVLPTINGNVYATPLMVHGEPKEIATHQSCAAVIGKAFNQTVLGMNPRLRLWTSEIRSPKHIAMLLPHDRLGSESMRIHGSMKLLALLALDSTAVRNANTSVRPKDFTAPNFRDANRAPDGGRLFYAVKMKPTY